MVLSYRIKLRIMNTWERLGIKMKPMQLVEIALAENGGGGGN